MVSCDDLKSAVLLASTTVTHTEQHILKDLFESFKAEVTTSKNFVDVCHCPV